MQEILTILSSVGFNWHVALANFVNFLIILFLLNKFFFKKIGATIDTRHAIIEEGIRKAHEAKTKLEQAEEEKKSILISARKERDTIVLDAQSLAHELAKSVEQEAQASIDVRMAKIQEEEKNLRETVENNFQAQAPFLVAKLYAKTLMKELTEEDNNALIASMKA